MGTSIRNGPAVPPADPCGRVRGRFPGITKIVVNEFCGFYMRQLLDAPQAFCLFVECERLEDNDDAALRMVGHIDFNVLTLLEIPNAGLGRRGLTDDKKT